MARVSKQVNTLEIMELFNVYTTSPLAKVGMEELMQLRTFCKDNFVEVYAYTDKVMIVCGVSRSFKYPKNVTAEWLKGGIEKVMSDYKKSNIWKILHG